MSAGQSSSYINDDDQNRMSFNSLFSFSTNTRTAKPYSKRNLPDSFYRPPSVNSKSRNIHRQHTKSQSNLSDGLSESIYHHNRRVSDTAIINESNTMDSNLSQINSSSSVLPLPDDWEEKLTSDGKVYYIDHRTQYTTWDDPRPKHYAAFQSYCCTLPLPNGFEQTYDSKGNQYFIDHHNQRTYWEDPRPNFYRSLMTKRLDASASASSTADDLLSNQLIEIFKEKQALQLRTQELERMEADIRQQIDQRTQPNNPPMMDSSALEFLIDDLFLHSRQNSTDSGLDDGRCGTNPTTDGVNSNELFDTVLFPDTSNTYNNAFPLSDDTQSQNQSIEQP